jgi:hypothetical protein
MAAMRVPNRLVFVSDATPHIRASERKPRCLECRDTGKRELQTGPYWADFVIEDCPFCGHHRDVHDDGECPVIPFPTDRPRPAA